MPFDIFEALNTINQHFGSSGDITVSTLEIGIVFTLSTVHKGQWLRKRFILSRNDLKSPSLAHAVDIRFKHAIRELQLAIQQIDSNPEENIHVF